MKLYYAETLNPRKACAVARYLNSPVEFVRVDLGAGEHKRPDFLAMNPNGMVPVLEDGPTSVWESNAIMGHLALRAGSSLWPSGPAQVEVLRWLSWDSLHLAPHAGNLYFLHLIAPHIGLGQPDAAQVEASIAGFRHFAAILNSHLAGRQYVVGQSLTIADFALAISLPYAEGANIPVREFPEIVRWHARLNELDAWREPWPTAAAA